MRNSLRMSFDGTLFPRRFEIPVCITYHGEEMME